MGTPQDPDPYPARATRATMRDVAQLAGVGVKTVSRVINGQPNVSDKLAARVRSAAEALSYLPDVHAGNLRRQGRPAETLGVVVENIGNQFWADIVRAIEDVAVSHEVAMLASSHDGRSARELDLVARYLRQRVDGLIVATIAPDQSHLAQEQKYGTPIVFIDREPVGIRADTVMNDNAEIAAAAVEHLLRNGHRRIAYIGDRPSLQPSQQRLASYLATMEKHDAHPTADLVREGVRSAQEGFAATMEILSGPQPPTAIFSAKDQVSEGVLRALHATGMHRRIAHIGVGDLPLADVVDPGLTAIAQNPTGIGRLAAEQVFSRLGGDLTEPRTLYVESTIVVRGSGEIAPS